MGKYEKWKEYNENKVVHCHKIQEREIKLWFLLFLERKKKIFFLGKNIFPEKHVSHPEKRICYNSTDCFPTFSRNCANFDKKD